MLTEIINTIYKSKMKAYEHVVGIDFNSTYSYFTFASKKVGFSNENYSALFKEDYECILKERSAIYYNTKLKYGNKFGKKALLENSNDSSGHLFQYFQPLLYRKYNSIIDDRKFRKMKDTDIIDLNANYLHDFVKKGLSKVKCKYHIPRVFWKSNIRYVVTTPKICSEEEKVLLKKAVIKAGIASPEDIDKRVTFISKTQASALYYDQYLHTHFKTKIPQYFMVCDACANTVTVSIFNAFETTQPSGETLLSELFTCTKTDGRSKAIDERFRCLLQKKIDLCVIRGGNQRDMDKITDIFVNDVKPNFSLDSDEDVYFPVPLSFCLPSFFKDSTGFIVNDTMRISHDELAETVFKPVTNEITTFIKCQLEKLPVDEQRLDAILLVGSFGQSPYLYREVVNRFEGKDIGGNVVLQLPRGELVACKGAASYGIFSRFLF